MDRRDTLITLNLVPGLGPATIHRLTEAFGSSERIFQADPAVLREILGRYASDAVIAGIRSALGGGPLSEELKRVEKAGVRIVTGADPDYPRLLKSIPNPPPVLYVHGSLWEEDEAAVALVGTRRATPYGLNVARGLAQKIAEAGITVVSGLAEGIDRAGHEGALEGKGRTIAVLGHGLSTLFPFHHRGLAQRIIQSGALVSEFPMEMEPLKENFPIRNRVIAGLSLGVVVVEAPLRSGALITAREALEQGREVFAVPGPVSSPQSKGTHQLLRDGARLLEGVADLFEELAPALKERVSRFHDVSSFPPSIPPFGGTVEGRRKRESSEDDVLKWGLSPEESQLYQTIPVATGVMMEALAHQAPLPPSRLLSALTTLELKGLVRQVPGQGYTRVE